MRHELHYENVDLNAEDVELVKEGMRIRRALTRPGSWTQVLEGGQVSGWVFSQHCYVLPGSFVSFQISKSIAMGTLVFAEPVVVEDVASSFAWVTVKVAPLELIDLADARPGIVLPDRVKDYFESLYKRIEKGQWLMGG